MADRNVALDLLLDDGLDLNMVLGASEMLMQLLQIVDNNWARARQDWLLPQWRNVLFSDESRTGLVSDDYREIVWRKRGGQNRLATALGVAPYHIDMLAQVMMINLFEEFAVYVKINIT
nr:unnamed protein product [Callosobruchus chinensis]